MQKNYPAFIGIVEDYFDYFEKVTKSGVGGNWGGAQGIDDTIFPATMQVDYVKVYKLIE